MCVCVHKLTTANSKQRIRHQFEDRQTNKSIANNLRRKVIAIILQNIPTNMNLPLPSSHSSLLSVSFSQTK